MLAYHEIKKNEGWARLFSWGISHRNHFTQKVTQSYISLISCSKGWKVISQTVGFDLTIGDKMKHMTNLMWHGVVCLRCRSWANDGYIYPPCPRQVSYTQCSCILWLIHISLASIMLTIVDLIRIFWTEVSWNNHWILPYSIPPDVTERLPKHP